ncbi:cytochrome P450 83B1-like [Vigna unguiculata]|uniref:Cytochrome P450 n=1 Tax=Vigna unguiculata TaxID=3917 RepID=A0A4D6MS34_VIGUN|nr:cytochrome P450 83B1-like [Vigna unguiculata]XP_027906431.1 cytochrome P450 83B1-like [Vigna unguiculata]QCE02929.1 cytochrome P450 [Vigna unguiculata]
MVSPLVTVACLFLPLLLLIFFQNRKGKNSKFPPGPRGLPIVGNLLSVDSTTLHLQLWELSKKYGPIVSLRFGSRKAIAVCTSELAREVLKDRDLECCGRPKLLGQQTLFFKGYDVIFSPYGEFWREIRKICVLNVLSQKQVSTFSPIRHSELKDMMKRISRNASSGKLYNFTEATISLTSTIICRILFGRSYEDNEADGSRFYSLLKGCQEMMVAFFFSDFIPSLGWIDTVTGKKARLRAIFQEVDSFFQDAIDEHLDPKRVVSPENQDITDIILQLQKQRTSSIELTDDVVKAILMDLLLASTDSSSASLVWNMTALLKNPRVMKKLQDEIRGKANGKEFLDDEDVQNLPYLRAVIKETFRYYPPGPILVQRETNEDCVIGGYEIPAKTTLYVNAWAIHKDENNWKNPFEYYPERFMDSNITFRGTDYEFLPFGSGRRVCPGMPMAIASLDLILANLLNSFDWELPNGMKPDDLDVLTDPGLTVHKRNPLHILPKRVI